MILSRHGDAVPWRLRRAQEGSEEPWETWEGLPQFKTLVNAPDMLLRMACADVGITAVGAHFAQPHVERGELVRVLPDWELPPTPCWAVFAERRLMPLRTRAFLDAMVATLSRCPSSASGG
jgi:DNA-binding transcriptional LysR family regulator